MPESFLRDPEVTPFYPCPNCARLLSFGLDQCPHCRELVDEDSKFAATILSAVETQACSLANTISTGDPAVLIFLVWDLFAWLIDLGWMGGLFLLNVAFMVWVIGRWMWRFGRLPALSQDLLRAKREMRQSLLLWLAVGLFQTVFSIYTWRLAWTPHSE